MGFVRGHPRTRETFRSTTWPGGTSPRPATAHVDPAGPARAVAVELARAILLVGGAVLGIVVVLPALLALAGGPLH